MTNEPKRDQYGNDLTVWVIWAWFPSGIGWTSQRVPYSTREHVEARADVWRRLYVSWGLPGVVEVRSEHDGEPADPEPLTSPE